MSGKIFISYRRVADAGFAQALFPRLEAEFGHDQLFMDVGGYIKLGEDFVQKLEERVTSCDVVLAVIGPGWLDATDDVGNRRLDDPSDFVRIELASALQQGKRVIPILVNDARIPRSDALAEPLRKLVRLQGMRLTNERFADDCHALIGKVREILFEVEASRDDEDAGSARPTRNREISDIGAFRGGFWSHLLARHPSEADFGAATRASSRWRSVGDTNLVVVKYISRRGVGIFIRGERGADPVESADRLMHVEKQIGRRLAAEFNNEKYMFHKWMSCDGEDQSNWNRMADWVCAQADRYDATLKSLLK